tara:strand:+ start:1113 stop:1271 length:159 start_codon:yes stop_codon:yes gene_type:complete
MITYILISYFIMAMWAMVVLVKGSEPGKEVFKMWVMSPVTLPVLAFITFISW